MYKSTRSQACISYADFNYIHETLRNEFILIDLKGEMYVIQKADDNIC